MTDRIGDNKGRVACADQSWIDETVRVYGTTSKTGGYYIRAREGALDRFPTTTSRTAANVTSLFTERAGGVGGGLRYAATVPAGPKRTRFFPEFPPMTLTAQRDNYLPPSPPGKRSRTLARSPDVRPPPSRVLFPPWKTASAHADYDR